jgi:hypothetical protein
MDCQKVSSSVEAGTLLAVIEASQPDILFILPGHVQIDDWYLAARRPGVSVIPRKKIHGASLTTNGREVAVHSASTWFGATMTLDQCIRCWNGLNKLIREQFDEGAGLRTLPSNTGLDLLKRSLPFGKQYSSLPSQLGSLMIDRKLFGQAHIETFPRQATLSEVYNLDGVWMYAACLRDLPTGDLQHDYDNEFAGYVRGFYRVTATIPSDWNHIGLLRQGEGHHEESLFPRLPGQTFESWVNDQEYRLAVEHGWKLEIHERVLWPQKSSDPLLSWIRKLTEIRETCARLNEPARTMSRGAIRNIVLHTVGAFARQNVEQDGIAASIDDLPDDVASWEYVNETTINYTVSKSNRQSSTFMPHWANYIWAHARVRLHKACLQIPFEQIISVRTDGIWLSAPPPEALLGDGVKVGTWRLKHQAKISIEWPQDNPGMLRLMQTVKAEEED